MREGRGNTTVRDHHRRIISRQDTHCGICHEEIDYTLPYLHPQSFVVDHIIPVARGGTDDLENKQAAHRKCNRDKGDLLPGEQPARAGRPGLKMTTANPFAAGIPTHQLPPGVTFITARNWWQKTP